MSKSLTLVGRGYCHLCDDMRDALLAMSGLPVFDLNWIDVDADPVMLRKYDELVPVLLTNRGRELCHYHLDRDKVREYLLAFE